MNLTSSLTACVRVGVCALTAATALAQTAAPPAAKPADEETVTLSPFTVSADKSFGYMATSTLAGTRLRTELKDVGTSISVVTAEFLQDTAATNTQELLTYVTGSEVGGLGGNFSGASVSTGGASENLRASAGTTRLRGMAAASDARNFFRTSIPLDSFNIERVEINRGANAILFGTGSPAGIINSSLRQARMKDTYTAEVRGGSHASARGSFDLNQQLVKGQLAIRVDGLENRQKYEQNFAFEDQHRLYTALTYDPQWARTKNGWLSGTVLRANAERGSIDSRRPKTLPPIDSLSGWFTPWFPTASAAAPYPAKFTWDAGNLRTTSVVNAVNLFTFSPAMQTTQSIFRNASVWFNNPASSAPGTGSIIGGVPIVGRQGVISNLPGNPLGTALFASASDVLFAATRTPGLLDAGFYIRPNLVDETVFDYRHHLLEGPNRSEYAGWEAYNVVLEQRFLSDRAGVEFAFDTQRYREGGSNLVDSGRSTEIRIDINTTLLDGTPNPNFGRPLISNSWSSSLSRNEGKAGRATVFYKFDFAEVASERWAKWLGKLTFTGLHEEARSRFLNLGGQRYAYSGDYPYGNNQLLTDFNGGALGQLSYLGPSLANATSVHGGNLPGLNALQVPASASGQTFQFRGQTATSNFVTVPMMIVDDGKIPTQFVQLANKGGSNSRAQAGIVQGKLLHDALVATFGWRRDTVESFSAASPTRGARNNLIVDEAVWVFPRTPSSSVSDETQSQSFVFHVPDKLVRRARIVSSLSLRYNTSQNFSPGSTRYDSNGAGIPTPSGTTKDVGFHLGLAKDRIVLGATWYTTKQNGVTASGIGGLTESIVDNWRVFTNITNLGLNPNSSQVVAPPKALLDLYSFTVTNGSASYIPRPDIVLTQDVVSKGVEFELTANVTRNWRFMLNAARQAASRSNTGKVLHELFFERKINGQTLNENWSGPAGQTAKVSEGGATLASQAIPAIVNAYNLQALQDGGPAQELRKWRTNLVTNYTFSRESRFKGFGVGSGVRWQDKVAIGFPNIAVSGIRVPDVAHPFYGPTDLNLDSWIRYERRIYNDKVAFSVQFNVFNVLGDDDLVPIATQPTGRVAAYRMPAARRSELTTKFDF